MLKTGYQKFIIALLLLAFTSQTMATAATTCQLGKAMQTVAVAMDHADPAMAHMHHHMSDMPAHDMAAMSGMDSMTEMDSTNGIDHSQHTNSSTNPHQTFDCCKTMGHCLLGGCSLAAAATSIDFLLPQLDSATEDFYSGIAPAPLISSLYRPPISC